MVAVAVSGWSVIIAQLDDTAKLHGIYQHAPGFASRGGTDNSGGLKLVHDFSRPVVSYGITPLKRRS